MTREMTQRKKEREKEKERERRGVARRNQSSGTQTRVARPLTSAAARHTADSTTCTRAHDQKASNLQGTKRERKEREKKKKRKGKKEKKNKTSESTNHAARAKL